MVSNMCRWEEALAAVGELERFTGSFGLNGSGHGTCVTSETDAPNRVTCGLSASPLVN